MNQKFLKTSSLAVAIAILASFAFVPAVNAYGNTFNWQLGFAGTFVFPQGTPSGLPPGSGTGFWGWCGLAGVSSGTDGDCHVANYVHEPGTSFSFTCQTSLSITGWDTEFSSFTGTTDFFFTSGHVAVTPSHLTTLCLEAAFPPGIVDPSTGNIIAPFDTMFPNSTGHISGNFHAPGINVEFQAQITFTHA